MRAAAPVLGGGGAAHMQQSLRCAWLQDDQIFCLIPHCPGALTDRGPLDTYPVALL